ncbi:MAG: hypothetical protein LRY31_04395 [Burkholderiaceae bacterium]|nr:hypothetical protein [Burkholderiaceae bacterium]
MTFRALPNRLGWLSLAGATAVLLSGCDMLGVETPGMANARKAAEARAIGAACRHAVRSIEDCHASNPRISRASIFEGWREMDEYMRENEVEGMPATPPTPPAPVVSPPEEVILPSSLPQANQAPPGLAPTGTIQLPAPPSIAPGPARP